VENEIFEALKRVAIAGGLEETLRGLQIKFSHLAFSFVIIIDSKEEE
jgi:hypothetical protein